MKNIAFLLFGVALIFGGCNHSPKSSTSSETNYIAPTFAKVDSAKFKTLIEPLPVDIVYDIDIYKNYIILLAPIDGKWLHLYDAVTGGYITGALSKGRGPNEVIWPYDLSLNSSSGEGTIYDRQLDIAITLNIDSIAQNSMPYRVDRFSKSIETVYPCAEGWITYELFPPLSKGPKRRFAKQRGDSVVSRYDKWPFADPKFYFDVYDQPSISISPDKTKLAMGSMLGNVLEVFDISEDIENLSTCYFVEPKFERHGSRVDYSKPWTTSGFGDLYLTDKYIYGSYADGIFKNLPNNITIFDWEGKAQRLIKTDYSIARLCVTNDNKRAYAVVQNGDKELFIAVLDL